MMMKKIVAAVVLSMLSLHTNAYISAIAIHTENSSMHVFVNGKLYNKQPGKFVRIKSLPGLFHLQVKVLNPYDKIWYVVRKDVKVRKGYELYYKVVFSKGMKPRIQEVRQYPVYSKYFLNPSLYNRSPIS